MTSKESSIQPRAAAMRARRCCGVVFWKSVRVARNASIARIVSAMRSRGGRAVPREPLLQRKVALGTLHIALDLLAQRFRIREFHLSSNVLEKLDSYASAFGQRQRMEVQEMRF